MTDTAVAAIRAAAQPLPSPDDAEAFGAAFDRFGSAKVVLLGEATHGTSEFYRARAAITRRLIEQHGFTIVAAEADWPDASHIDQSVRRRPGPKDGAPFERFPTWMWRNLEFATFTAWLRTYNDEQPPEAHVEFRGLDLYSLNSSISAVLEYLAEVDPEAAAEARRRYACLTPWQAKPERYGALAVRGAADCRRAVVDQLREVLLRRLDRPDGEPLFDAEQNARVVQSAEAYYRAMYEGSVESWNLRDTHMFATLEQVLAARGDDAKAVIWAHNSHIGDARFTEMGWGGELNLGQLCRQAYGDAAVLVGFGTDRGTVAAATDWGGPMEIKAVRPSHSRSWERAFLDAGAPSAVVSWRNEPSLARDLAEARLERAIGVIYRPESERYSHYFDAELSKQFDAYIWLEETTAVTPVAGPERDGDAELFPYGV
jgi:erythromycin esterase-like protein